MHIVDGRIAELCADFWACFWADFWAELRDVGRPAPEDVVNEHGMY